MRTANYSDSAKIFSIPKVMFQNQSYQLGGLRAGCSELTPHRARHGVKNNLW